MSGLRAGIAQVDYTPALGLPLMGNFRDDYGARGVHDPLYAKAVVLVDPAGSKVALLSVDICVMYRSDVAMMRQHIASQARIAPENILIACTHTHSGPSAVRFGSLPKADDGAVEAFLKKAAEAVVLADQSLEDVALEVGYSREDRLSFNRRLKCRDGQTHMNWEQLDPDFVIEPLGPVDPEVIVASVVHQNRPQAALVSFGLHPAVLAGDNWLYSADYPGYLAEAMLRVHGDEFATLFFNGCCGNINHIDYRDPTQGRGFQMTQRIGYMLAVDCLEAMKTQTAVEGHQIGVSSEDVRLERLRVSEEKRKWSDGVLASAAANPALGQEDGLPDEHFALLALEMYERQDVDDLAEVMVMRIGDLGIVGLPGELFCELGMQIKQRSPAEHTVVIELANGWHGYIPTRESFSQGGYEATPGSTLYAEGAGEKLVASALAQLSNLFG
jgi:hypothetical protein